MIICRNRKYLMLTKHTTISAFVLRDTRGTQSSQKNFKGVQCARRKTAFVPDTFFLSPIRSRRASLSFNLSLSFRIFTFSLQSLPSPEYEQIFKIVLPNANTNKQARRGTRFCFFDLTLVISNPRLFISFYFHSPVTADFLILKSRRSKNIRTHVPNVSMNQTN